MTVSVHLKKIGSEEHLSKAFRYFDRDGSGYIEIDELREALAEGDPGPNEQAIQEIFSDVDVDKVRELTRFGSMTVSSLHTRNHYHILVVIGTSRYAGWSD